MSRRKITAGELAYKASHDPTVYNAMEVGHAAIEDVAKELIECAHRHREIFDEDEYCVGYVLAGDPLLKNLVRRKFFAFLWLPSPRPNQTIFLYNKPLDRFTKRLWCLPNAWTMACLSELQSVDPAYAQMKGWADAFFQFRFWEHIRNQHGISMLSQSEYLEANREELRKARGNQTGLDAANAFDFSKIAVKKIIDPVDSLSSENSYDRLWKAKDFQGQVPSHEIKGGLKEIK